ncbi:MAG: carboxypeptidase regulatory-like domain-containing protein [Verrucomicrobia bacterium]|nr:carboxypeptidase regulatory-like domain-containing protein [Verrucomicrobiota bacterium]
MHGISRVGVFKRFFPFTLVAVAVFAVTFAACRAAPPHAEVGFNPDLVEARFFQGQWVVSAGQLLLGNFGDSEADARDAVRVIKHYRFDKHCAVGPPRPAMEYWLVNGQAPAGPIEGEDALPFNPASTIVKQINGSWKIVDGDHWMLDFGGDENLARMALEVIRKYGFEFMCFVGKPARKMCYFRTGGAAPPPPTPPPAPVGAARLKVTVVEGAGRPAQMPVITVRHAQNPGVQPAVLAENPGRFELPPGPYNVTVRVGAAPESAPRPVVIEAGRITELLINTGTGTLELMLTAGGRPLARVPLIHLKAGSQLVSSVTELPAKFQAQEGNYSVEVQLPTNQNYTIPDLAIRAGETTRKAVEVPCAVLTVVVNVPPYQPGSGRFPRVELQQNGRFVAALVDNPARFQILAGTYTISARGDQTEFGSREIAIRPGEDPTVDFR